MHLQYLAFFVCTLCHRGHVDGILTKDGSLASIANTTNMASKSSSSDPGDACKPSIVERRTCVREVAGSMPFLRLLK